MNSVNLPFDPGVSGWTEIMSAGPRYPELKQSQTADVVIVGAGFAGLSAARRLQELNPNSRIVVLEARHIAEGPAGRNSGFMIDVPHNLGSKNYLGTSDEDRRQILMNREAIEFAKNAADEFSMSQDAFGIPGKINGAATETGVSHNLTFAKRLEQLGEMHELLDEKTMNEVTGSNYYLSGLAMPGTAMIQPATYITGLARGIHAAGVEIFERTPVVDIVRNNNCWKMTTPAASIEAEKVVLAVNGHVENFGFFRHRLIHIYLYASMTRRLTQDEAQALGGEPYWGLTPSDPYGTTVRRVSGVGGDRIIVRNGITWSPNRTVSEKRMKSVTKVHDDTFRARFPQLGAVTMDYRWGGLLCLSRNSVPAFGELETNLYSACCQNGLGTTKGTLSGKLIAETICGLESASLEYFQRQPEPTKMPPEPFASIGGEIALRWGEFKAGKEK